MLDGTAARPARMHGLWALVASGPLDPAFHAKLLDHAGRRPSAPGACARRGTWGRSTRAIRDKLSRLVARPEPRCRLQVAIAASKIEAGRPAAICCSASSAIAIKTH